MITIKSFEFNYFQENTFLLYDDTREAVLIDCGLLSQGRGKGVNRLYPRKQVDIKAFALYSSARGSRIWKRFYI